MVVRSAYQPSEEELDGVFHALSDSTRRHIIQVIGQQELSISELAQLYPISFAAIQKHVAVLERCGLITKKRSGRQQLVCRRIEGLQLASQQLRQFEQMWVSRLNQIDEIL